MSDDSKDWVNIRIEEPVRDDARADDRTYTEIMADGLAADRGELEDVPEDLATDILDTIGAEVGGPAVDDSEIAREVARQIDYAQLAGEVAKELEGRMR